MTVRKISAILLAIVLCVTMALPAAGETVFQQSGITVQKTFSSKELWSILSGTELIEFRDARTGITGLMDPIGRIVVPADYLSIDSSHSYGLFEAVKHNELNNRGIIDSKGNAVVPLQYGDIKILSKTWCAGIRLATATGEAYDYSSFSGNEKYIILDYTIYNMETGAVVGTLDRMKFQSAKAYGDHLFVEDRNGKVTVYNDQLKPVGTTDYTFDGYAREKNQEGGYDVFWAGTKDKILSTKYQVSGFVDGGEYIRVKRGGTGLMDFNGDLVVPCEYDDIDYSVRNGYIKVELGGLYGLSDLQGNLVVDCEYDDFVSSYTGLNDDGRYYFVHGYCPVKKGGKFGYINDEGKETCPVKYSENAKEINACSAIMSDMEGNLTIIAADGTVTHTQYKDVGKIYNDIAGILLWACDQQDKYGIIDWHGNIVVPFEYSGKYGFKINEFGTLLLVKGEDYNSPTDVYTVQYP